MRQTCERAGYRRLNFAGRQPPVFRKAVPSVFAFPLHLDCIVPIQKDIRLSGRTEVLYRTDSIGRPSASGFARAKPASTLGAADGRTGCGKLGLVGRLRSPVLRRQNRRPGAEKLPLHDNVSPPAPSASRFAERNVQDGQLPASCFPIFFSSSLLYRTANSLPKRAGRTGKLDAEDFTWSTVRFTFAMRQTCERVAAAVELWRPPISCFP